MSHPIDNIEWIPVEALDANGYNPNTVFNQELALLKFSILKQGWIQPVLASRDGVIIDGYHRWWLTKNDGQVYDKTAGRVPVAYLDISEPERMLLTVRINRAKGSHMAVKMHELVRKVVSDWGYSVAQVCEGIGATKDEVNLLLQENIFKKLGIERHEYSKAWYPKK